MEIQKLMTNSEMVEIVYRNHNKWLNQVAYNFTNNKLDAEELVQDLYLRLMEMADISKIKYNNTVNLYYLYKMLRSIFLNQQKVKINALPIDEELVNLHFEEYDYASDNEHEETIKRVNEILEKDVYWFDSKLFRVYIEENHSIKSLSKATKISSSTIWTSLSKTKAYIKQNTNGNR
jgi:RNA polymerase sigma factor (sigma-70 family)